MPLYPWVGQISFAGCRFAWQGSTPCDGSLIGFNQEAAQVFYFLMGNSFGGVPGQSVRIPDLQEATVIGVGDTSPLGSRAGLADGSGTSTVGLTSVIATEGDFPTEGPVPDGFYLGEIIMMPILPRTLMDSQQVIPCDGRSLAVSDYSELFTLIGSTYGGDGVTTFKVPNLSGAMPQQPMAGGTANVVGAQRGSGSISTVSIAFYIVAVGLWPSQG